MNVIFKVSFQYNFLVITAGSDGWMASKTNVSRTISVFDNRETDDENKVGLNYSVGIVFVTWNLPSYLTYDCVLKYNGGCKHALIFLVHLLEQFRTSIFVVHICWIRFVD